MKPLFTLTFIFISVSAIAQFPFIEGRNYTSFKTSESLTIDGEANEAAWKLAAWSDDFIDIEGNKKPRPYSRTRVKMLWDDTYFYVYAEMEEPHIWANLTQRDAVIFHDNDFEIFIDPDGDTQNYYEFEVNALNTVWDLLLTRPYRDHGKAIDHWDIHGLKSAVHLNGTINNPNDIDQGWSVEVAIPWEVLSEVSNVPSPPKPGDQWRLNFSRVQWETEVIAGKYVKKKNEQGKNLPENNWVWSPQRVIAMHEPEFWGTVVFSDIETENLRSSISPINLNSEKIRQALYYIHRAQLDYRRQNGTFNKDKLSLFPFEDLKMEWTIAAGKSFYMVRAKETANSSIEWCIDHTGRIWKETTKTNE